MKPDIDIIHEDSDLLIVNKPVNFLSQKDHTGDPDIFSMCKEYLSAVNRSASAVYLGLLHRLDRQTGGIMVLAKTKRAASDLSEQIRKRLFRKRYLVVVSGDTPPNGVLVHHLSKDHNTNRVRVTTGGTKSDKKAELSYVKQAYDSESHLSLLQVQLITGRAHQIRVQFAHTGYPLPGDHKYGIESKYSETPSLFAQKVAFTHPATGKKVNFTAKPPKTEPWTIFECD